MRVVVDTNIVVSAILRDRLPEKVLLFVVSKPGIEWDASPEILAEYCEVLARPKFAIPQPVLSKWHARFQAGIAVAGPAVDPVSP